MKHQRTYRLAAALFGVLLLGAVFALRPAWGQGPLPPAGRAALTVAKPAATLGTTFTYQGRLNRDGAPVTDTCNFQFGLYDVETGGAAVATQSLNGVAVTNGLFTARIDFGNVFHGAAYWVETAVQCPADAGFVTLDPRKPLDSAPYALGLMPGASVQNPAGDGFSGNSGAGYGLTGNSQTGYAGVYGASDNGYGVFGSVIGDIPRAGVYGKNGGGGFGVFGQNTTGGYGVFGLSVSGSGVDGDSTSGSGVSGQSQSGYGVSGNSQSGYAGVFGASAQGYGVYGLVNGAAPRAGVYGKNEGSGFGLFGQNSGNGAGVFGLSAAADGIAGRSDGNGYGVSGSSANGYAGVYGTSSAGYGMFGVVNGAAPRAGMYGRNDGSGFGVFGQSTANGIGVFGLSVDGPGIYGRSTNGYAAEFDGRTRTKLLEITGGADLAERFEVSDKAKAEPGTLMIIDAAHPGHLKPSDGAYDTRVAGVVSGAGGVQPGLTLHQDGVMEGDVHIAIAGRVYVRAEADSAPIRPGDLLTTSSLPGHAMKASDRSRAYGAVIGKAMTGLEKGAGLVLVLVNLQ